ncbi:MAG: LysE family translocator [Phenylobacterium sp.]|uniref:LysE family translocator n=1 Tax=Phenylobacterium sp. TaxID=1871053 RepID=UPI003919D271
MTVPEALIAFSLAAGLLTITPGLDTALVLRTAAAEGARGAALAGLGVVLGCLTWGAAAAFGVGALLAASQTAFDLLRWAGAAYLAWLGINLILKPRDSFATAGPSTMAAGSAAWLRRGFLGNLLNPKVGVFYVSFLPQFTAKGVEPVGFMLLLAAIHALMGVVWFAALIAATRPIARTLRRPAVVQWLDRTTGGVFLAFAARLALERR